MTAFGGGLNRSVQHLLGVGDAIARACLLSTNRKKCCSLVTLSRARTTSDCGQAKSQESHMLQTPACKKEACCVDRLRPPSKAVIRA